jgi:ubiquinone biosynthesis protein
VSGSDEPATTELLLDWSRDGDVDHEHLRDDCRAFLDRYHGMSLQRIDTSQLLGEITSITRDNELFLPDEVALLIKVFVTLESLGRRLDPEFTVSRHVAPFAKKALAEHYSARAWVGRATREATHLLARLPRHMRRLGEGMRQGKVKITMDVAQLDRFGQQLVKSANRVTIGLVTSALIVGTSISLTVSHGPTTLGMPLFALLGFGTSSLGGFWLLWLILRSRR